MKAIEKSTPFIEKQMEKIKEYFDDLYIKRDIMCGSNPRGIILGTPGKGKKIRMKVTQEGAKKLK